MISNNSTIIVRDVEHVIISISTSLCLEVLPTRYIKHLVNPLIFFYFINFPSNWKVLSSMTIYENLGKLCAVSAVVVVGIILSFFIANAIYVGAYRLAKACFARFWAFILYAHGSRMKDIIFVLSLWFTSIGFWESLEPNCEYNIHIEEFVCLNTAFKIIYDPVSHYSEISGTPCLKWCIFLLLTLLVYIWDCLNAIVSLQAWIHHRCLPSKPGYFHFLVVCCALLQCTFIWFVFPWKFRWILQFAQLEAALSILQQILGGCQPNCTAEIIFGKFKVFCLILITFICCIYRTYVIANYIYRIAEKVQDSFATHLLNKPECRSEGIQERNSSRELSEIDDAQAETTMSMLKRSQEELLREFSEVKNLLTDDRDRFDEKLAGIEKQLGDNRDKSKKELAAVKKLLKGNREKSKKKLDRILRKLEDKSKKDLADV